ncbi:MAG: SCP2 sterol-binding domain-containing protein [Gammaproteobacteria bacterium]|nr:SCP2 sterol-binding domain-containing protein [Gammaproteobacteria bacterium]MDH4314459.1 SCP2 sterol-binding domain-containing protein [Gammaproteobacteria bacterium]MDH5213308.1 SCP2 sterol-binding domain-containing protein [Gammaproteobacteria bacterium]MDH5502248.1 SCP2 sterol-binding domain-containing protein [Gammaproteobacteria bacterium]
MDTLQTALRPLAALLNRQIRSKSPARALCNGLDGKTLAVRVRDTGLATYVSVASGNILLSSQYEQEPDAIVSGTLLSLLRLFRSADENMIRDGEVEFSGDSDVAQQFQELMRFAKPDPEEELSRLVGDVAAHGIGEFARGVEKWSRQARATVGQNISEYLQEESRVLPSRYEVDRFRRRVETLRDDVARLEAKLRRLEIESIADGDT